MDVPWFCYMLRCSDGALYVGAAKDLAVRLKRHNVGPGSKFTARRLPVEMIWWQRFDSEKEARGREAQLKGWRREKKLALVKCFGDRVYPSAAEIAASG